jgi:hypothetical protein
LYPFTAGGLASQVSVTECATGWTPVPDRETVAGELVALLVTVAVPVRIPVAAGVKVTFSIAVCPGVKICPVETPLAVYPAPEILTLEMVTFEFPALVIVAPRTLLPPRLTFPKLRLVALAASFPEEVVFADRAPEPVTPTQPERDNVVRKTRKMANNVSGAC